MELVPAIAFELILVQTGSRQPLSEQRAGRMKSQATVALVESGQTFVVPLIESI